MDGPEASKMDGSRSVQKGDYNIEKNKIKKNKIESTKEVLYSTPKIASLPKPNLPSIDEVKKRVRDFAGGLSSPSIRR
jgi:hypothetical protein